MQIFVFSKHQNLSAFILFCIDFKRANKQILEFAKKEILASFVQYKGKFKGFDVYEPTYTQNEMDFPRIGYPQYILLKNSKISLADYDFSQELLSFFIKKPQERD